MKTYVDLSWLRGKAKNVLIDEIRHVAVRNNFALKCENISKFINADFIYFDTEKKEITDKQPEKIIGLEITVNNALEGKYEPCTSVVFNGKKYKYVYNKRELVPSSNSNFDCDLCDFKKNNPTLLCKHILDKIRIKNCKFNCYFKECLDVALKNKINKKYKFHVGQRVQFKSWEEMLRQYGLDKNASIKMTVPFIEEMKYLCGTYATIGDFYDGGNRCYLNNFSKDTTSNCYFSFTTDMLKPASTKE